MGGVSTAVATGALALLSAGSLATLGLLGAGEIAGNGPLGSLPAPREVRSPEAVVVTPAPAQVAGETDDGSQPLTGPGLLGGPLAGPVIGPPSDGGAVGGDPGDSGADGTDGTAPTQPGDPVVAEPAPDPAPGPDLSGVPLDDGSTAGSGEDGSTDRRDRPRHRAAGKPAAGPLGKPATRLRGSESTGPLLLAVGTVEKVDRPRAPGRHAERPGRGPADVPNPLPAPVSSLTTVAAPHGAGAAGLGNQPAGPGNGVGHGPGNGLATAGAGVDVPGNALGARNL